MRKIFADTLSEAWDYLEREEKDPSFTRELCWAANDSPLLVVLDKVDETYETLCCGMGHSLAEVQGEVYLLVYSYGH